MYHAVWRDVLGSGLEAMSAAQGAQVGDELPGLQGCKTCVDEFQDQDLDRRTAFGEHEGHMPRLGKVDWRKALRELLQVGCPQPRRHPAHWLKEGEFVGMSVHALWRGFGR